jgi:Ca2+/H+ antiporter, TMEM165/GDT1 family
MARRPGAARILHPPAMAYHRSRSPSAREPVVNLEKVVFGFVIILACTLNFGFFIGDLERPELHHPMELASAVVVNLIATILKFGDRTQLGATHLATSLVASLQLIAASMVWVWQLYVAKVPLDAEMTAVIVSLSGGALLANVFSVILLLGETLRQGR